MWTEITISKAYNGTNVNPNLDRESVYGPPHDYTFDIRQKISMIPPKVVIESRSLLPGREKGWVTRKRWCCESIETWEVNVFDCLEDMVIAMFISKDTPNRSFKNKKIIGKRFYYHVGCRPSEDEIDDMLDKLEESKRVNSEKNTKNCEKARKSRKKKIVHGGQTSLFEDEIC